ncbi:MAG: AfsR/SARP family transcriptional regulator [Halanaerobiales bacterium]
MTDADLEVYMLGKFVVKRGECVLTAQKDRSQKLWKLFQILVGHPGEIISADELIELLDLPMELVDARNAVQNLVYRLRKFLNNRQKYRSEVYITYEQGGYSFNWEGGHNVDFVDFEALYKKCGAEFERENFGRALDYALEAFELYRGNFLVDNKDRGWVVEKRAYLRRIYLELIYMICELLQQQGNYFKIEEICQKALKIEAFDEEIHYHLLNSLLQQNKIQKAKLHYQYILNLLSFNKIKLSSHISKLFAETAAQEESEEIDLQSIKDELSNREEDDGPCLLSKEAFNYFVKISQRKKKREKSPVYLVSVSINRGNSELGGEDTTEELLAYLENIFAGTLRGSDVVCRWNRIQYLILFTGVNC